MSALDSAPESAVDEPPTADAGPTPRPLTQARLGVRPSPTLVQHLNWVELSDELVGADEYVLMDIAHAVMLTTCGVFDRGRGQSIVRALLDLREAGVAEQLGSDPVYGTLGLQIERYLEGRLGEIGLDIQRGRSRIDQKATGWRLTNRAALTTVMHAMVSYADALLDAADRYESKLAPGYTHLQHSQPTTLDHYFNAHYWAASRNLERLLQVYRRVNVSPLGGAAYSGTSWGIDREQTAAYLGFDSTIPNSRDAGMASLDLAPELDGVLALVLSGLSRVASDLNYWASSEVGFVSIDPSLCGTSSMMPQKRNPMVLERIRGLAGSAAGWSASDLGVLHTSTSTDVDQAYVRNPIPAHCYETTGAIDLLREVVETLEVDEAGLRTSAGSHWSTASALADRLSADTGMSFRSAHDTVARFIAAHERAGVPAGHIRMDLAEAPLTSLTGDQVAEILEPAHFVATRISAGGTSASNREVLAVLARVDLAQIRDRVDIVEKHTRRATEQLLADARSLAASP